MRSNWPPLTFATKLPPWCENSYLQQSWYCTEILGALNWMFCSRYSIKYIEESCTLINVRRADLPYGWVLFSWFVWQHFLWTGPTGTAAAPQSPAWSVSWTPTPNSFCNSLCPPSVLLTDIPPSFPYSKVCPLFVCGSSYVAFPAEAITLVLMCSQRLHKPSPSNRTCLYIRLRKKCKAEWQSRGKEGESTERMNGGSVGKKRKENG